MPNSIYLDIRAPLAELVLNKPTKRNALSLDMWAEIPQLIAQAVSDSSVKVLIIHGGDAGAFAAGADISEFATVYATEATATAAGNTIAAALEAIETCPKPVIAAIEGACFGAGVSIAMAADLRVASNLSTFGVPPGKLGLVYPGGDTRRLIDAIGLGAAKDILFTARTLGADEAKRIRLIDRLVPAGHAIEAARQLASEICKNSQWSTRATKQMIAGLQNGWAEDGAQASRLFVEGFQNEDFQDGYRAFLEKRPANFTYK